MAGKGLNMKEIAEIKRLKNLGLSERQIAKSLNKSRNTVAKYLGEQSDQSAAGAENFSSTSNNLYACELSWVANVDWEAVKKEVLQGIALNVIHDELFSAGRVPVQYPGFWKQVRKRLNLTEASMVRIFTPGHRAEIDYSDGIEILDPVTGEIKSTQLFVGVLCQSRYTFAEFTWSQKSEDFLQSHVNMFSYFQGVPQVISPDNLKSAVIKSHRYDPVINPAYTRLAEHYQVAVLPARVKTPKDKAIVERTIQIFQRWFFAVVRKRTFTSLLELNRCLKEYLEIFNQKIHRTFQKSRLAMYEVEKAHLQPLPETSFEVATFKQAILSRDCHFIFEKNFYSAPHHLRGEKLDLWVKAKSIEVYHQAERVALHNRLHSQGLFITNPEHYPEKHKAYLEEDVQNLLEKSQSIGPETEKLIQGLLNRAHPLKNFRRAQGIIALSWKHSKELLEEACRTGNEFNNQQIRYLESVIETRKGVIRKAESKMQRQQNPFLRGLENIH